MNSNFIAAVVLLIVVILATYLHSGMQHRECQAQGFDRYAYRLGCIKNVEPSKTGDIQIQDMSK